MFDAIERARNRVQSAATIAASRQRHIQRFGGKPGRHLRLAQRIAALLQRGLYALFDLIDARAGLGAFIRGQLAQAFEQSRQAAITAKIFSLGLFQLVFVIDRRKLRQRLIEYLL